MAIDTDHLSNHERDGLRRERAAVLADVWGRLTSFLLSHTARRNDATREAVTELKRQPAGLRAAYIVANWSQRVAVQAMPLLRQLEEAEALPS